jgi:hypothetical protein
MYSKLGRNMIHFIGKVEAAILKNYAEKRNFILPHLDELKDHISSLTAFLIGITDDSLSEFKKVIQQIEKTMLYIDDMQKNFVLAERKLPYFIAQISESDMILDEFIQEVDDYLAEDKISNFIKLAQQLPSFYVNLVQQITGVSLTLSGSSIQSYWKETQSEFGGLLIRMIESLRNEDIMNIDQTSLLLQNKMSELKGFIEDESQVFLECEKTMESANQLIKDYDSSILLAKAGHLNPISLDMNLKDNKQNIIRELNILVATLDSLFSSANEMPKIKMQKDVTQSLKQLIQAGKMGLEAATTISSIGGQAHQESFLNGLRAAISSITSNMSDLISLKEATSNVDQESYDVILQHSQNIIRKTIDEISSMPETTELFVESIDSAENYLKNSVEEFLSDAVSYGLETPADVLIILQSFEEATNVVLKNDGSDLKLFSRGLSILNLKSLALLEAIKVCMENAPQDIKLNFSANAKSLLESLQITLKNFKFDKLFHNDQTQDNFIKSKETYQDCLTSLRLFITNLEPDGFFDKDDPNFRNARDLATLANSLEQVSREISITNVKPPSDSDASVTITDNGFRVLLMKLVKEITEATTALLKASIVSQREIVKRGKLLPPAEASKF